MRLIFIRHGETHANAEGRIQGQAGPPAFPLSPNGRIQAERLRDSLLNRGIEPTHMYTSPLQRAIETAEILSEPWPIKFAKWDDLKEYGFGELTGLTRDEVMQRFPELQHVSRLDLIEDVYGVEPVAERGIRAIRVVETVMGHHEDESTIFMVTHGGILQNIVSATLGSKRTWEIDIANTGVFDLTIDANHWHENGEARLDSSLWHINLFGDASHLC